MTHLSDTARQTPAGALPTSMRAVTRRRYGGPEVVGVETLERPEPAAGELLLRVRAAGLDRATLHLLEGKPYLARLAFGLRRPGRPVLGQQVAGEVVAVGADVSGYAVGDRVFGTADGSFAEYAVAKVSKVAATPDTVRDVDAATLGVSGTTALDAVNHVEVAAGQKVLVLGASGAVGTLVVQLAVHRGAEVTAVCSAAKLDLQRLNAAGSVFVTRPSLPHHLATREELLWRSGELFDWIGQGRLTVAEPTRFGFDEAGAAYAALEGRRTTGKVLLVP